MDENPKTIMTGFAPLDFVVAIVSPSITESIIASWDSPPLHEVFAIAVRSLLTSYPLLYSVPILFIDSLCGLLECIRSRETSHSREAQDKIKQTKI